MKEFRSFLKCLFLNMYIKKTANFQCVVKERIYLNKTHVFIRTWTSRPPPITLSKLSLDNPKLWYSFLVLLIGFKVLKAAQKLSICHRSCLKMTGTIYEQICWLLPTNCLSVFNNLVGLALKGIKLNRKLSINQSNFFLLEKHLRVHRLVLWEGKNQTKIKQLDTRNIFNRVKLTKIQKCLLLGTKRN